MTFEQTKAFLIADDDADVREAVSEAIKHYYKDCRVYTASDGSEAMQKLRNAPPHLVIIDLDMPKVSGIEMIEQMQKIHSFSRIPVIVISGLDHSSDEVQSIRDKGMVFAEKPFKTQYLMGLIDTCLSGNKSKPIQPEIKKLAAGEILFQEGDPGTSMYLVKSGKLRVYKSKSTQTKEIGIIGPNELVGEMAFVDRKPRSATIEAIEETELVDLPIADVHDYLNNQPVWLKSIFTTLLARMRNTIEIKE